VQLFAWGASSCEDHFHQVILSRREKLSVISTLEKKKLLALWHVALMENHTQNFTFTASVQKNSDLSLRMEAVS